MILIQCYYLVLFCMLEFVLTIPSPVVENLCSTSKIFGRLILNRILEIEAESCTDITVKSQHGLSDFYFINFIAFIDRGCVPSGTLKFEVTLYKVLQLLLAVCSVQ